MGSSPAQHPENNGYCPQKGQEAMLFVQAPKELLVLA